MIAPPGSRRQAESYFRRAPRQAPKADMAENCAAASRPGSARAPASDNNSGKSFRLNIDLGCGAPPVGRRTGRAPRCVSAASPVAKIAHIHKKAAPRVSTGAAQFFSTELANVYWYFYGGLGSPPQLVRFRG